MSLGPSGDELDREIHDKDIDLLWSGASSKFTGLGKHVHKASACMFTNTPDEHFVLDTLPDHPQATSHALVPAATTADY